MYFVSFVKCLYKLVSKPSRQWAVSVKLRTPMVWTGKLEKSNRLELPALVTASVKGHTENETVRNGGPHEAACASELSANTSFL